MGGTPFSDGSDHGGADDEFAAVVFDEAFIRSARIHEPTAHERMVAAAQARTEAETRTRVGGPEDETGAEDGDEGYPGAYRDDEYGPDWDEDDDRYEESPYGYRRAHTRWHRTVAWVLAVVMGVGVVLLTVAAVYRGASGGRQQPAPPPGNSRMDSPSAPAGLPVGAEPVSPRP
ncbi:hypothetical protein GCM10012280_03710 [Wenjunlia tyrosinilytica]|uniref:Uncharacterized protein n=1 Tax=Wenjunlia tyrosinilytica TaxID=1544741 RepID=A0A917ZD71_9ACTN|nr:hypothetical protein GCM10012280_03710 [Wenjunlia tyrosinilytica]